MLRIIFKTEHFNSYRVITSCGSRINIIIICSPNLTYSDAVTRYDIPKNDFVRKKKGENYKTIRFNSNEYPFISKTIIYDGNPPGSFLTRMMRGDVLILQDTPWTFSIYVVINISLLVCVSKCAYEEIVILNKPFS